MKAPSLAFFTCSCLLAALFNLSSQPLLAQEITEIQIVLLSPLPGSVAIGKKPKIVFRTSQPVLAEGAFILLDGDDITEMVTAKNGIYSYTPVTTLGAGEHNLYVAAFTEDGFPAFIQGSLFK